jgi:hypothetical protein
MLVLGAIIGLLASIMMIGVVNNYVFLYMERGPDGFEFEDVWEATRGSIGKIFLTALGIGLIGLLLYGLWIVLILMTGLFGALIGMVLMFAVVYFAIALTPLFTVRLYEDAGLGEAISRCMELVKGNWWLTFGVLAVVYMVTSFIAFILAVPAYVVMFISAFNAADGSGDMGDMGGYGIIVTVFMTLYMIASYLLSSMPLLAGVLHYFNLVEKSEGVGMMAKIDAIGKEEETGGFDTTSF